MKGQQLQHVTCRSPTEYPNVSRKEKEEHKTLREVKKGTNRPVLSALALWLPITSAGENLLLIPPLFCYREHSLPWSSLWRAAAHRRPPGQLPIPSAQPLSSRNASPSLKGAQTLPKTPQTPPLGTATAPGPRLLLMIWNRTSPSTEQVLPCQHINSFFTSTNPLLKVKLFIWTRACLNFLIPWLCKPTHSTLLLIPHTLGTISGYH